MIRLPAILLLIAPALALAHGDHLDAGTQLDVALSASWRDNSSIPANTLWQIPGVLMGGHALPSDKGSSLDEASLTLSHLRDDGLYGLLKAETHGDEGLSLEHAYVGYRKALPVSVLQLEAGRMNANFSPANREHASSRLFSETPLVMDAFFGRHFVDDGLRISSHFPDGITVGIESWKGRAFPASRGQGSSDIFINATTRPAVWQAGMGAFALKARADNRIDERYSAGHSHGGNTITGPDITFSGDTTVYGLNGQLGWSPEPDAGITLSGEILQQEPEGRIQNSAQTRQAAFSAEQTGGYWQLIGHWQRHELGLRQEGIVVSNRISGPAAALLASEAGLINNGDDASRLTLTYAYRLLPGLKTRLEWVQDDSSPTARNRVAAGITWQETLWKK